MTTISQQTYAELFKAAAELEGVYILTPEEQLLLSIFSNQDLVSKNQMQQKFVQKLHLEMKEGGIDEVVDASGNSLIVL